MIVRILCTSVYGIIYFLLLIMIKYSIRTAILDYGVIYGALLFESFMHSCYLLYINADRDLSPLNYFILLAIIYLIISLVILLFYYFIFRLVRAKSLIPKYALFIFFLGVAFLSSILWEMAYSKMLNKLLKEGSFLDFYFSNDLFILTVIWLIFFVISGYRLRK